MTQSEFKMYRSKHVNCYCSDDGHHYRFRNNDVIHVNVPSKLINILSIGDFESNVSVHNLEALPSHYFYQHFADVLAEFLHRK